MINSIQIHNCDVHASGYDYTCNFSVFFEPKFPSAELFNPDGTNSFDIGQDEVVFLYVNIESAYNHHFDHNAKLDTIDERINLEEALLKWCDENPLIHMEAFKQLKNAE